MTTLQTDSPLAKRLADAIDADDAQTLVEVFGDCVTLYLLHGAEPVIKPPAGHTHYYIAETDDGSYLCAYTSRRAASTHYYLMGFEMFCREFYNFAAAIDPARLLREMPEGLGLVIDPHDTDGDVMQVIDADLLRQASQISKQ